MNTLVTGISIATVLIVPLIASYESYVQITGNIGFRFLLVGWVFYAIRHGPVEGLFALLAAVTVISERSHQILTSFPSQQPKFPSTAGQGGVPQQIAADVPHGESVHYDTPQEEEGKAVVEKQGEEVKEVLYEEASDLQDSIPRIGEVPQGEAAASFFEQKGLA